MVRENVKRLIAIKAILFIFLNFMQITVHNLYAIIVKGVVLNVVQSNIAMNV